MSSTYKRIKVLGKGGFGTVTLVSSKNKNDNRLYVLKEIKLDNEKNKASEAMKEATLMKSLHHPNIIGYVQSFVERDCLCIVMEYADGGDLYSKIRHHKTVLRCRMSEETILDMLVQICLGLKHMHDRHILHRDIKSQNVFLTKSSPAIIKLGDLGISRQLNGSMELARTQIGTPYYLSPEIIAGKHYGKKSDMYSLGVVLFEMMNLELPFQAQNFPQLVTKILAGPLPPLCNEYSLPLRNIVFQLLERDPKNRPSVNSLLRLDILRNRMQILLSQNLLLRTLSSNLHVVSPSLPGENPGTSQSTKLKEMSNAASNARKQHFLRALDRERAIVEAKKVADAALVEEQKRKREEERKQRREMMEKKRREWIAAAKSSAEITIKVSGKSKDLVVSDREITRNKNVGPVSPIQVEMHHVSSSSSNVVNLFEVDPLKDSVSNKTAISEDELVSAAAASVVERKQLQLKHRASSVVVEDTSDAPALGDLQRAVQAWKQSRMQKSRIDPVSTNVSSENAREVSTRLSPSPDISRPTPIERRFSLPSITEVQLALDTPSDAVTDDENKLIQLEIAVQELREDIERALRLAELPVPTGDDADDDDDDSDESELSESSNFDWKKLPRILSSVDEASPGSNDTYV
jgi:NIMA (never in mitosis gene a)-related kinase 1/4/5